MNNLFRHPYTRIDYLRSDLSVTRQTAARHLDALAEHGFVEKHQAGRHNYDVNRRLVALFLESAEEGLRRGPGASCLGGRRTRSCSPEGGRRGHAGQAGRSRPCAAPEGPAVVRTRPW
ncbi:MAG: hypothetical protein ACFB6R_02950 [Alphaproteobacteria bacterium]